MELCQAEYAKVYFEEKSGWKKLVDNQNKDRIRMGDVLIKSLRFYAKKNIYENQTIKNNIVND